MKGRSVLIVDDEKNILLTLSHSLEILQLETDTAANGEEALSKLKKKDYSLILLDLRMPGIDGMEVLRQVRQIRPDILIIMISAYGTIELAVEAIKLGAVDFIQKPFSPEEVRELVSRVLDREKRDEQKGADYVTSVELAKKSIGNRHFDAAIEHARRAIFLDPSRPEAFNLLGTLLEIRGNRIEAQRNYRAALSLDPSYAPAVKNLERTASWGWKQAGGIVLEETKEDPRRQEKK